MAENEGPWLLRVFSDTADGTASEEIRVQLGVNNSCLRAKGDQKQKQGLSVKLLSPLLNSTLSFSSYWTSAVGASIYSTRRSTKSLRLSKYKPSTSATDTKELDASSSRNNLLRAAGYHPANL